MTSSNCRYPEIVVPNMDGENSLVIVGTVVAALREHNVSPEAIREFRHEALTSDYRHVLATVEEWVHVT